MSDWNPQPIQRDVNFISDLIHRLKEGQEIWFSYDKITGHQGVHVHIKKISNGREYEYYAEGDLVENPTLDTDEDIQQLAREIVNSNINYYNISNIRGYKTPRIEPEDDDQAIGDYEKYGVDHPVPEFEYKTPTIMKEELLENLVRYCVREMLRQRQLNEGFFTEEDEKDDTVGASAPPADGQGTADQLEIPDKKKTPDETPKEPETPKKDLEEPEKEKPVSTDIKGISFINPRDKAKLQKLNFAGMNDITLVQGLDRIAKTMGGANAKTASNTVTMVKDAVKNPNSALYLYLGKYDPNSGEVFLMADKSLQVAKDSSASPADVKGLLPSRVPTVPQQPQSLQTGQSPQPLNENARKVVKNMINELLG